MALMYDQVYQGHNVGLTPFR
jgi:hypothetical protein